MREELEDNLSVTNSIIKSENSQIFEIVFIPPSEGAQLGAARMQLLGCCNDDSVSNIKDDDDGKGLDFF